MLQDPPIIVSNQDLERLEQLLDSLSASRTPGVDALQRELERAEIVELDAIPSDVITMNSTARCINEDSGKEFELTLTYPVDTHMTHGKVTVLAPVGSALLGLSVGQSIEWPVPSGRKATFRVLEVSYQPEAARKQQR